MSKARARKKKTAFQQKHEEFLAQQLAERDERIAASKFWVTDRLTGIEPTIEGQVRHLRLTASDGSTVEIDWDPYTRAFQIRAVEAARDVSASAIEVLPHACNVVSVRPRQGTAFITDPIAEKLAAGATARREKAKS